MDKPKVIILSAGKGTRLGSYSQFFNKSMIKVGDVGAISHIFSYFPKESQFIVVIGHLADLVKQYCNIMHPELDIQYVLQENNTKGPGDALLQCEKLIDGPFYMFCNDTLIGNPLPEPNQNWIGYAEAQSLDGEYSGLSFKLGKAYNMVSEFYEKNDKRYCGNAYIGATYIKDWQLYFKGLRENPVVIDGQHMVSAGFYELLKNNVSIKAEKMDWFDIGTLDSLQETRAKFKGKIDNLDKTDEEIYFQGNRVIKYFYNSEVCKNRVKRARILKDFVPEIQAYSDNFYAYKFVDGVDLFDKSIQHEHLPSLVESILTEVSKSGLWKEITLNPEDYMKFQHACVDFYYRKTKNRLDSLYKQLHFEDAETVINGEKVPKLKDLLSVLPWQKILNGKPCLMHGDLAISNVLLTPEGAFKFIDWRQDFGGLTEFGDVYYDLSKLLASLVFPHDIIKQKRFTISISGHTIDYKIEDDILYPGDPDVNETRYGTSIMLFNQWCVDNHIDFRKVKQLTAIVLLNMAPLHSSPLNVLLYYLGKKTLFDTLRE